MDVHSKEIRSKNMRAIRASNTKIEVLLGKALWARGLRYRRNNKKVIGKPDFTFARYKLAIFCDSEFFHGKDWNKLQKQLGNNREFWVKKIEGNIKRDSFVNEKLTRQGWSVLRFWGNDIKKNVQGCVQKIEMTLESLKNL
jgi:DNA mismatch endonuclease Vsr